MHSSQSGVRPRQRTFTSCTECRRRKQRCNQAKDRPCNNCARRYPPVACIYETTSTTPTYDYPVDFQGQPTMNTTYMQTSDTASLPVTSSSGHTYYSSSASTNPYYASSSAASMRPDYRAYPDQSTSTAGGYATMDTTGGYYSTDQATTYSTVATTQGGYYPTTDQSQATWGYSVAEDPATMTGSGSDYYYVCDPDAGNGYSRR